MWLYIGLNSVIWRLGVEFEHRSMISMYNYQSALIESFPRGEGGGERKWENLESVAVGNVAFALEEREKSGNCLDLRGRKDARNCPAER